MTTDTSPSYSEQQNDPLEYRIAIADAVGCDAFRETVMQSNSNSDSAIYYRKAHLKTIASYLDVDPGPAPTVASLRDAIRMRTATAGAHPELSAESRANPDSQAPPTPAPRAVPDGGAHETTQSQLPGNRFGFKDLIAISRTIGVEPDGPYAEKEFRKLAGSSLAGPYLAELVEKAFLDVYVSINDGSPTAPNGNRGYYPYRFQPVHEVPQSQTSRPPCCRYVIDSSFKDETITNIDVLNTAARVNADAAILADVPGDMDATVAAVLEGLELYDEHHYQGEIIIPLQAPYDTCIERLINEGVSTKHTFALGGLKDEPDHMAKISAAEAVRDVVGYNVTLHGLGFGITQELAAEIRSQPDLLDSVDASTTMQNNIGDPMRGGMNQCSTTAMAGAEFIERLRWVSPLVGSSEGRQSELEQYESPHD